MAIERGQRHGAAAAAGDPEIGLKQGFQRDLRLLRRHDLAKAVAAGQERPVKLLDEQAIAERAITRGIGARGLRAIMEDFMLEIMYKLPGESDVKECVISRKVVENEVDPLTVVRKVG